MTAPREMNAEITQDSALPTMTAVKAETVRKLQDLADLRQLKYTVGNAHVFHAPDPSLDCFEEIVEESDTIETSLRTQAEKSYLAGSYQESIYIYNHLLNQIGVNIDSLYPDYASESMSMLVKSYDRLGDFAAAEKLQEQIVDGFRYCLDTNGYDARRADRLSKEIDHLMSLYTRFYDRLMYLQFLVPNMNMADLAKLTILRRAVSLKNDGLSHRVLSNATIELAPFPLHLAARAGATEMAEILLDRFDYDINAENQDGSTALHEAIRHDQLEILGLLLERSAYLNILAVDGEISLHFAIRTGSPECVRTLLARNGSAMIRAKDDEGREALHLCVSSANEDMVRTLLSAGASIEATDLQGRTALHYAARSREEGMVTLLLEADAAIEAEDNYGMTALMIASRDGSPAVVQRLLRKGADLERRKDDSGFTPFIMAAGHGRAAMVEHLVTEGANIGARDKWGRTALHIAAMRMSREEDERVLRTLLESQIDKNVVDENGETPLAQASRFGSLTQARILLDNGASPNVCDKFMATPLHRAVQFGPDSLVPLLILKGAHIEAKDLKGRTPLCTAAVKSHDGVLRSLLDHGANKEATDNEGDTPLAIAVRCRNAKSVWILLEDGASVKHLDKSFKEDTLLHTATRDRDLTITKLLLNAGADVNARNSLGESPLHLAIPTLDYQLHSRKCSPEQLVAILLKHDALPHTRNRLGETPLYNAVNSKNMVVVKMLLKAILECDLVETLYRPGPFGSKLYNLCEQLTYKTEVRDKEWREIEETVIESLGPLRHDDESYSRGQQSFSQSAIQEPVSVYPRVPQLSYVGSTHLRSIESCEQGAHPVELSP